MANALYRITAIAVAGAVLAAAAQGAPPSHRTKSQSAQPVRPPGATVPVGTLPNIKIAEAWLGPGTGDRFAYLGALRLGETISLVCDVELYRNPEPGWHLAWIVDGVTTCGEGTFTVTGPPCEYAWNFSTGAAVFIDYVFHTPGSHTYKCEAVPSTTGRESTKSDNAKTVNLWVPPLKVKPPAKP
jgi:hypothetical protein